MSYTFARNLGLFPRQCKNSRLAGQFHDIGKILVDPKILFKPGVLTEIEFATIKEHPFNSFLILLRLGLPADVIQAIIFHHENWNGTGYPYHLKGESIPLVARILHIIDTFDALIADRPYRLALPTTSAIGFIKGNSGTLFDPTLVREFQTNGFMK